MIARLAIAALVLAASLFLIRYIERTAERIRGDALARWSRLLIPVPIILLLLGNLDGVLSLLAYLEEHPAAVPARYSENQAWNTDRFFYAGMVSAGLLPFGLGCRFSLRLVAQVWIGFVLWIIFPFSLLLLATGVPLQD